MLLNIIKDDPVSLWKNSLLMNILSLIIIFIYYWYLLLPFLSIIIQLIVFYIVVSVRMFRTTTAETIRIDW